MVLKNNKVKACEMDKSEIRINVVITLSFE